MRHARSKSTASSSSAAQPKGRESSDSSPELSSVQEGGPLFGKSAEIRLGARDRSARAEAVIQPKVHISEPADRYEKEAERIADTVMRMPESESTEELGQDTPVDRIQRMCHTAAGASDRTSR